MSEAETYDIEQARQLMAQMKLQLLQKEKDMQQRLSSVQEAFPSMRLPPVHRDIPLPSDAEHGWKHVFYALRRYRRSA